MGRAEPEVPSIAVPLAAQRELQHEKARDADPGLEHDSGLGWEL
ncbi:MAG: hypothetical protein ACP5H2_06100 [Solirubrobacteraceae bacterium]